MSSSPSNNFRTANLIAVTFLPSRTVIINYKESAGLLIVVYGVPAPVAPVIIDIVKRACSAADAGADRCASANVGMGCSANAGPSCSAKRRTGQSSAASGSEHQQNSEKPRLKNVHHGPPPGKRLKRSIKHLEVQT